MRLRRIAGPVWLLAWVLVCYAAAGCDEGNQKNAYRVASGGNAARGKQLIDQYGCGACHMIPGVMDARGLVGPPLIYFADRTMIAGELPNTPPNLVRWLVNPPAIEPHTAMPNVGLSQSQAQDIAAYLYTIRGMEGKPWNQ